MAQVALPISVPTVKAKPIIYEKLQQSTARTLTKFCPEKHLSFTEPPKTLSLAALGLPDDAGISPVGVSNPFPLFTQEAIQIMRSELFTKEVWENCMHSTEFAGCQIRGQCPRYAPFTYEAWNHPKVVSIVSQIAGVDLVPVMDLEIASVNISVEDPNDSQKKKTAGVEDDIPVTKWHVDSYPFVCVLMMSDASNMVGGETALKSSSGEIMKVRGPQMGCAVVLQGRCIEHQALAAHGGTERITAVTSFRPRDPMMADTSVLTSIRPISDHSELYYQWAKYRAEVLQGRLRGLLKTIEDLHHANKPTDKELLKRFFQQQEEWISITNKEIV